MIHAVLAISVAANVALALLVCVLRITLRDTQKWRNQIAKERDVLFEMAARRFAQIRELMLAIYPEGADGTYDPEAIDVERFSQRASQARTDKSTLFRQLLAVAHALAPHKSNIAIRNDVGSLCEFVASEIETADAELRSRNRLILRICELTGTVPAAGECLPVHDRAMELLESLGADSGLAKAIRGAIQLQDSGPLTPAMGCGCGVIPPTTPWPADTTDRDLSLKPLVVSRFLDPLGIPAEVTANG